MMNTRLFPGAPLWMAAAFVALVACSPPREEGPHAPVATAPASDLPVAMPSVDGSADDALSTDAAVASTGGDGGGAASTDSGASYRAYVAPPPRKAPSTPLPVPTGAGCEKEAFKLRADEEAREWAALDASLRTRGGMLIEWQRIPEQAQRGAVGTTVRGPAGERWLVVGETLACGGYPWPVAIDSTLEVFEVHPAPKAKATRRINSCTPLCSGCGTPAPPMRIVVEVPDGARLGRPRDIAFPMDTRVAIDARDKQGRPMPCPALP